MLCRFCGNESDDMTDFNRWVKPTFVDHDKLLDGDGVCDSCLFWFDERSAELAALVGKDKPQRMRNYSHFVVSGMWIPLSKADKQHMQSILLGVPFPELATIAESGQKHIVFRARRNPLGATCGWVQFEEQSLFVQPMELKELLTLVESLHAQFSKEEIETGDYVQHRVRQFGVEQWWTLESGIKSKRGGLLFQLALFLAQRSKDDTRASRGGRVSVDNLARRTTRLQEPLPNDDMATVRGPGEECSVHEQPGDVRQLSLFES
jgi:hypothetical protein